MRLFLLRHAHAKETFPDSERELSQFGRSQVECLCRVLDPELFSNVVQIWHSPYRRAVETTELFEKNLSLSIPRVEVSAATPDDNPEHLARMVVGISSFGGDLILVSHNPFLERLAAVLLSGKKRNARAAFGTSTFAELDLVEPSSFSDEYGIWTLNSLISPEHLCKH